MKGISYILEVLIAVSILFLLTVYVITIPIEVKPKIEIKLLTYNLIENLLYSSSLRDDIINLNTKKIEDEISNFVKMYEVRVAIFDEFGNNVTEIPEIEDKNVVVISYFIAGNYEFFLPCELRVYLVS